jgi:hypothetical protein
MSSSPPLSNCNTLLISYPVAVVGVKGSSESLTAVVANEVLVTDRKGKGGGVSEKGSVGARARLPNVDDGGGSESTGRWD